MDPLIAPLLLIAGGVLLMTRKPFRLHPVEGRIGSRFGPRVDPVDGAPDTFHNGVDYPVPIGTPARSIGDGRVSLVGRDARSGLHLIVQGSGAFEGWSWSYSHLADTWVADGSTVAEGEHIADTGDSGRVTGPHLHFVVKRRGLLVDPSSVLP